MIRLTTIEDVPMKQIPEFDVARCKKCGICKHFCSAEAIDVHEDGTPYLARPKACTSCALCRDMCPDWAIRLCDLNEAEIEVERVA